MKILFVTTECVPFAKTGGMADVSSALPKELRAAGADVRIYMPRYRSVPLSECRERIGGLPVPISSKKEYGRVHEGETPDGVPVYFIDHPRYFDRRGLYVDEGRDYPDNAERFTFFCRSVAEFITTGEFVPDVVHVNDWFGSLVPVYFRTIYRKQFEKLPVLLTIHNLAYQGIFWHYDMHLTNLPWSLFRFDKLEFYGKLNFLKGGIIFSDQVTTVSPRYAEEIQTKEYGCGLEGVLRKKAPNLRGILNGVDYSIWNPENDARIARRYSAEDLSGKAECKRDLQNVNNITASDGPLFGMVSRFTEQKGINLILEVVPDLVERGAQFVFLGTGEKRYEEALVALAKRYPLNIGVNITFSDEMSHKIEAGADIFLMPSRFEPCGLNQLYSFRYGTPPVAHRVGGLSNTVSEWNGREGNGFLFDEYTVGAFSHALDRAIDVFSRKDEWNRLMKAGMKENFSWSRSASEYLNLYGEMTHA